MKENKDASGLEIVFTKHETKKSDRIADLVCGSLAAALLFFGLSGALYSVFALHVLGAAVPLLLLIGLICVFLGNAGFVYQKRKLIAIGFPAALAAVLCMAAGNAAANGFCLTANQIFTVLGRNFGRIFPIYQVTAAAGEHAFCASVFLVIAVVLLAYLCLYLARSWNWMLSSLLALGLLLLFSVLGRDLSLVWFILLFGALVLLFYKHRVFLRQGSRKQQGEALFSISSFLALLCGVLLCLFMAGGLADHFQRLGWFPSARSAVISATDRLRYEKKAGDILPEGDFSDVSDLELKDTPALEVVMSKPESLYLRGYVGSVYNGKGWAPLDNERLYDEYAALFYWLHQDSFYGQTQLARAALLLDPEVSEEDGIRMAVNNIGANSKYIYAPYEAYRIDPDLLPAGGIGDADLRSPGITGSRFYRYTTLPNQVKKYTSLAALLSEAEQKNTPAAERYLITESHYNQFVYDNFTALPENIRNLLSNHLGAYDTGGKAHLSYSAAKQNILQYLTTYLEYSEEVSAGSGEGDFLQQFLEGTRSGYSIHYATAAALMFRYYGIPARYVEGYIITPQDVDGLAANSVVAIDGTHAHAWVEIYQDGIGWVPFEATPPYLDVMETAEEIEGADTSGGESPQQEPPQKQKPETAEGNEEGGDFEAFPFGPPSLVRTGLSVLVAAVLLFLLICFIRRKSALSRRLKSLEVENNKEAIQHIFAYTMDLLAAMGLVVRNGSLYDYVEAMPALLGEGYGEKFSKVADIHQEARFSSHRMTDEQRKTVIEFHRQVLKRLIESSKLLKRFSMRARCLY